MSALLWLSLGLVLGAFLPDGIRLAVKAWVRGAWGLAWGRVGTRAPAPAGAQTTDSRGRAFSAASLENAGPRADSLASGGRALVHGAANIARFFLGALGWIARNPMLALALVLLALFLVFGGRSCSPFDWGKSRGELRLEREIAEMNARVAEFETKLGQVSRDLAVNTERDRGRRAVVIAEAEQELDDAAAQLDPQALHSAYRARYLCVLGDTAACPDRPNPPAAGAAPMRGARPDAA